MKYLFVLSFIAVHILFGTEIGYTTSSPLYTHLTYMFQHAGIAHLVLNSIAFIAVYHGHQQLHKTRFFPFIIIAIGFSASFLSAQELPTVGASSMIYGMMGINIGSTLFLVRRKKMKIANTRRYLLFLSAITIGLLVSYFRPHSNFFVHLYSLIFGLILCVPLLALSKSTNTRATGE